MPHTHLPQFMRVWYSADQLESLTLSSHHSMNKDIWFLSNAILGSLVVTVGLWLLLGDIALPTAIILTLGLAGLLAWKTPSIALIWAVSTLLLGLESLAWPLLQMAEIRKLGPEPPLEDLQRIFTAVLFGLFSGVFWMTFSYGIYKRTRPEKKTAESSRPPNSTGKKKKSKGTR